MVRWELIPEAKTQKGKAVAIQCAHGDKVLYPLADIEMEVEWLQVKVQAAVYDRLPVPVLLGTDVPEMGQIQLLPKTVHTEGVEEVMVVTRAQKAREDRRIAAIGEG